MGYLEFKLIKLVVLGVIAFLVGLLTDYPMD